MNRFKSVLFAVLVMLMVSCKKDKTSSSNVNLTQGLLGYYPFNGNTNDESGKGNHGTIFNGATIVADKNGKPLSALSVTGTNGVLVTDGSKLISEDEMTISFDVMQRVTGTRQTFISSINYNNGFGFQYFIAPGLPSDPKTYVAFARNGATCTNYNTEAAGNMKGFTLEKESWYTIVTTFKNGAMKAYVNGTMVDEGTAPSAKTNPCTNSNFIIGAWWKTDPIGLNGKIDNVRVYNRVLNADEINALKN